MLKIARNKIIDEMHHNGCSVLEIANELRVDTKTIYNVIKKKNKPSLPLAASIARFFGKNIEEIFEFEDE